MAAIVGCTAVIGVSAETTTNLGSYEVFSSDGKATFMDYSEDEVNVIIPYMVEGNPITAIAPDVFLDKVNTENICIDESSEYFTSVDGVLFTNAEGFTPLVGTNQDIYLGVNNWDPEFNGFVDDVQVYIRITRNLSFYDWTDDKCRIDQFPLLLYESIFVLTSTFCRRFGVFYNRSLHTYE